MSFLKPAFLLSLQTVLGPYKAYCDTVIDALWKGTTELDAACLYALQTGGKRFRPALVWMVEEALGQGSWKQNPGPALACEYFHTASLIADDLPCMDNDDFRRGKPTTHKQFSESTALLSSFALISEGFRAIAETPLLPKQDPHLLSFAISEASRTMGIPGLLGGQQLDLHPPKHDFDTLMEIVDKKTGALFELCFVLGWIFGGGKKERIDDVRGLASSFGRAFQLIDDIDDYEQDIKAHKTNNCAVRFGLEEVISQAKSYALEFKERLQLLHIEKKDLQSLADVLLSAVE